jgi:hypothetical protein
LLTNLLTDLFGNLWGDLTSYFDVWPESGGEESINREFWFRAFMLPCILYHAPDSCPCFLNKGDPVKKVGYKRIPPYTACAEFLSGFQ